MYFTVSNENYSFYSNANKGNSIKGNLIVASWHYLLMGFSICKKIDYYRIWKWYPECVHGFCSILKIKHHLSFLGYQESYKNRLSLISTLHHIKSSLKKSFLLRDVMPSHLCLVEKTGCLKFPFRASAFSTDIGRDKKL